VKLPYFIPFGPHQDLTVTPYFSTSTQTVELAFRKELRLGSIRAEGAVTEDDIEGSRGYLFADTELRLPRGFQLHGQVEFVSDPGYLFTYNYSEKDRLTNEVAVTRYRDKDRFHAAITEFRTLRPGETPIRDTLPDRFVELSYSREIPRLSFGGTTVATIRAAALNRPSSVDIDGRDTSRIGVALDWRDDWMFGPGLVASAELGIDADGYNIGQDSNFESNISRVVPRGAVELRWPFARRTKDGGREFLEPIIRFDFADRRGEDVPIEDSAIVEFDEANLFSHSRYPGIDGAEEGARVAVGVAWRRADPSGWTLDGALGRVAHLDGDLGFAEGSGLVGDESEWLLAARFGMGDQIVILNRSLFEESLDFTLSETRVDWRTDTFSLGSSYVFAVPEPAEGRDDKLSEWSFEGDYALNDRWTASAEWRYDFTEGRAARTGVGLGYRSECIDVSFTLSRRFADSTAVDPTTDFGLRVELIGAGGDTGQRSRRSRCRG
jgi:LPS-assembly protein